MPLRRRLGNVMIIMAVIVMTVIVMGHRRVGVGAVIVVMFDLVAARIAGMGAENRDQRREDGAEQRQEDDCLIHAPP